MSDYDRNKLRRLDLTVLLIFLGLMRTRKAADVAGELGLTNSSISHAIKRLREVFEDELFLRRPHGLEPTAFSERIEPDVRKAVDALQFALAGKTDFDPATAKGLVRVAANDREVATLIPETFARVSNQAPGIRFSVRHMSNAESLRGLSEGILDIAIGFFRDPGPDVEQTVLRTENYLVTARKGHDIFNGKVSLKTYLAHPHILVSGDGSLSGVVDQVLAEKGRSRRVCIAIPSFLPALSILAKSDFIATLPSALVQEHADLYGLKIAPPPIEIRSFNVSALRHRRNLKDPMISWCLARFAT